MRLCLFEDGGVANLEPLTLTRPVFQLLCGLGPLAGKHCRYFRPTSLGVLVRPYLAPLVRTLFPSIRVNDLDWLRSDTTLLVNGRWLPPADPLDEVPGPGVALIDGDVAWAVIGPQRLTYLSLNTLDDCLATWKATLPKRPAGGRLLTYPWQLIEENAAQIGQDYGRLRPLATADRPGCTVVGPRERLRLDPTAQLDPLVVADTRGGPVVVDQGAVVHAFTRLEGPCYVGPGTHLLGAKVRAGTSLGPNCRVGGEVEASIFQGHANKYHDGFVGHSYVGEWVNLGAGTQVSDLRNDYGQVTVTIQGEAVETGQTKVGSFLGDHTKTGLGTLLNTGTVTGIFCQLLPTGRFLPKYVPSFCSVWNGQLAPHDDLAALLKTAERVMRRRGVALGPALAEVYRSLHRQTATARYRAVSERPPLRLRRPA